MNLKLNVWRQKNANDTGSFETFQAEDVSPDMSFLEMLDVVNEKIVREGGVPIAFDHDCREGFHTRNMPPRIPTSPWSVPCWRQSEST